MVAAEHRNTKAMRLRRRADYVAVQSTGKKIHGRHLLAIVTATGDAGDARPIGRLGVTVTKKIGNAVTRNRIKRLVREWFRTHGWIPAGLDVVMVAKDAAKDVRGMADVTDELSAIRHRLAQWAGSDGAAR